MKGTCSLSHLLHALQDAIGLLSAKEAGVVGTHGLLRAHGQHLSLSIHHPSAGLTHTCPASISQEGAALVPLKPLLALCKESKGEQISFQHNAKTHDLVLQQANGKMKLQGNNPADYPEFSTDPFVPLATMSSHQLSTLLAETLPCVGIDQTRYVLNFLRLEFHSTPTPTLRVVTTNGYHLTCAALPVTPSTGSNTPFTSLIHDAAATALAKLLRDREDHTIEILSNSRGLQFRCNTVTLTTRAGDGSYPEYRRILDQPHSARATVNKTDLLEAIQRIMPIIPRDSHPIDLSFNHDHLMVSTMNPELGHAQDYVPAQSIQPGLQCRMNAHYLRNSLTTAPENTIQISMTDANSPCKLQTTADRWQTVIMPIKMEQTQQAPRAEAA